MKFILAFSTLFLTLHSQAEITSSVEQKSMKTEVLSKDFGDRKRKEKRINKKRKRKCHQFGRKIYAG